MPEEVISDKSGAKKNGNSEFDLEQLKPIFFY
jgi:hypothetical protein